MRNKKTVDAVWGSGTSEAIKQWGQPRFYYIDRNDIFALLAEDSTPEIYAHDLRDDSEFLISLSDRSANDILEMFFLNDGNDLILGSESAIEGYEHLEVEGVTDYEGELYALESRCRAAIIKAARETQDKPQYILPLSGDCVEVFGGQVICVQTAIGNNEHKIHITYCEFGNILMNKEIDLYNLPIGVLATLADSMNSDPEKLIHLYDDEAAKGFDCYYNYRGLIVLKDGQMVVMQVQDLTKEGAEGILNEFWAYLNDGGNQHIVAVRKYLQELIDAEVRANAG